MPTIYLQNTQKGVGKSPSDTVYLLCAHKYTGRVNGLAALEPPQARPKEESLEQGSVLQEMADRAAVELARVAAARPALSSRCERAEGILAKHVVSPRAGAHPGAASRRRARRLPGAGLRRRGLPGRGEGLVALLVPGPPRAASPADEGSRACKHGLACWALWRAAVGAPVPAVSAVEVRLGASTPSARGRRDGCRRQETTSATLRDLGAARDRAREEYLAASRTLPGDTTERGLLWREFLEANAAYVERKDRHDDRPSTPADFWGEPVHAYTRADALADGVLVDVTATAGEAGFRIPVALTQSVWADVNDLSGRHVSRGQSPEGRLWDLLFMAAHAARRTREP